MAKKRANGEGNIRKRKDGRWEGRYTAGHDANGKAIYKNVLGMLRLNWYFVASVGLLEWARRKILCKRFSTKSRMALESRADSGLNPLFTESHGGQNGMRAGTA